MPNRTFSQGNVNIYTETCKNCGFSFTYKATSTLKVGKNIHLRIHKKKCPGKTLSKDDLNKITLNTLTGLTSLANNTVSGPSKSVYIN